MESFRAEIMRDLDHHHEIYKSESEDSLQRKRSSIAMQRLLIRCQEIGDEKLHLLQVIAEHIENRSRQLEQDRENLDPGSTRDFEREEVVVPVTPVVKNKVEQKQQQQQPPPPPPQPIIPQEVERTEKTVNKRQRRQKSQNDFTITDERKEEKVPKKKKKRKVKKEKEDNPLDFPIDPDEPTYCLCDQVSYGEMIGCDNDSCEIEWFHFNCVNLTTKPKGKWYCPNCRGENSKVMRKM